MKRYSPSLVIRKKQIKTMIQKKVNDKGLEEWEPSYTADGNDQQCSHFGKQSGSH